MMIRKMPKWIAGAALVLVAGAAPLACGGGGGTDNMAGSGNDEDGTGGGNDTDGTGGGNDTDGSGGTDPNGTGGSDGEAGADGSGGTPTVGDATIDDLIAAVCEWEFGCCDDGERTYRLGSAGDDVQDCIDVFTFQFHSSNTVDNPYPASGLLGTLGYVVVPSHVTENPAGIGECVAAYEAMGCPEEVEVLGYCEEPMEPGTDVCALGNLFNPDLDEGEECKDHALLKEGFENDVECKPGTTCVPAGDPDNTGTVPVCVQRGEADVPCTEDNDCDYNFYCDSETGCTEKGDEGDECTFNDDDPLPLDEDRGCKAGLKCNPDLDDDDKHVCVSNCAPDYPCAANTDCPEDYVCAPVTIGSDAVSWHQCLETGSTAEDNCDADDDCDSSRHCSGGVCTADFVINAVTTCTRNEMCEGGSFCDLNTLDSVGAARTATAICTGYLDAGDPCFYPSATAGVSSGCGPDAPLCLYNATDAQWQCTDELRGSGDHCFDMVTGGLPSECAAGLNCETTDAGDPTWPYTCTAGADLDEDCDAAVGDDTDLDCGTGLTCKDAVCIAQLDAGEDCEDADTAGVADPSLCKNGACVENWDENGPEFICSDAPVPESNGGDNLTCGGE